MLDITHTYFNILKHQILKIETEEVEVVKHSMELKEEYQSILNTMNSDNELLETEKNLKNL